MSFREYADDRRRDPRPEQLPAHLRERLRALGERAPASAGELVLYWMHHAVRGHENPALDAALLMAEALAGRVLAG